MGRSPGNSGGLRPARRRKDHQQNLVGAWARLKLGLLEKYLAAYCRALSKWPFRRVYIDAFAGAPVVEVRRRDVAEQTLGLDIPDLSGDDEEAQRRFILGSPARALGLAPGFHAHHFFDMDEIRVGQLRTLAARRSDVQIEVGDCNPAIQRLAPSLASPGIRGVAFLDPYGAHLEWATVAALARTGRMEVIINFPHRMDINRRLRTDGSFSEQDAVRLDACFGTPDWRGIATVETRDLFGAVTTAKGKGASESLSDLYVRRLKAIFPEVSKPFPIRNTKGAEIYQIIWAGPNPKGRQIITDIMDREARKQVMKRASKGR